MSGIDNMESAVKHLSDDKDADSNWIAHIIVDIPGTKVILDLLPSLKIDK